MTFSPHLLCKETPHNHGLQSHFIFVCPLGPHLVCFCFFQTYFIFVCRLGRNLVCFSFFRVISCLFVHWDRILSVSLFLQIYFMFVYPLRPNLVCFSFLQSYFTFVCPLGPNLVYVLLLARRLDLPLPSPPPASRPSQNPNSIKVGFSMRSRISIYKWDSISRLVCPPPMHSFDKRNTKKWLGT